MYFKLSSFSGVAPAVDNRRLGEQFGQISENINFESGALAPTNTNGSDTELSTETRQSMYFYEADISGGGAKLLQWNDPNVSVVKGPVPNDAFDRLYWTGEGGTSGAPRIGTNTSMISGSVFPAASFRLGIPAPTGSTSVSKSGTPDSTQTPFDVSYVYTFVSAIGEEGPPSAASTPIVLTDTEQVVVSLPTSAHPASPDQNYNLGTNAKKRIYRSNTGSTNTQFQFVGEVAFAATSFTDTKDGDELGEVLPSDGWIPPPNGISGDVNASPSGALQGLTALSNGILAGFTGNRLCLTEPFLPHAWPISYRITIEDTIVGIASSSQGVIVLTEGFPFVVTGVDPSSMSATKIDLAQACINKNSIVDMGEFVLYAAPDGLVAVAGNQGRIASQGLISPSQWASDFKSSTIKAFRYENKYVAFYEDGGAFKGWVYDPTAPEAAFSTLTQSNEVVGGYYEDKSGKLYIIKDFASGTNRKYCEYEAGTDKNSLTFKSKVFLTPYPVSFNWISVDAESYPVASSGVTPVTVKVFGDGTLIAHYVLTKSGNVFTQVTTVPGSISNATLQEPVMRLPASVAKEWEVQVSGTQTINEVCIAQSIEEVKQT